MSIITDNFIFDVLILISLITLGIYVYLIRNYNYWKNRGVKELPPSFLFGNIAPCIFARQTPQDFLMELYRNAKGERIIGFYVMDKPYLMLRDPELIRNIFIKDFGNFSNKMLSGDDRDTLGSMNLFLAKNPPWKYIRQKLTPIFTSGKLKKMYELMLEICEDFESFLDNLEIDDKIGKSIEMKEVCAKFTTDLIGTTAFGMKFNSLLNPEAEFRKYGRQVFRSNYKRYLQLLSIFFVPDLRLLTNPKFFDDKGSEFLRNTFWHVINERIKTGIKRNDLIDLLIDIKKNQESDISDIFKLEGDALVAQAAVFFTGGFETSSTTMSFALYELAKNLEIQVKLRKEIQNGLEKTHGKVTYDLITNLPYLNMVVLEALRMYPVLAWLDRLPDVDYILPGSDITITKGTPIILPMRAMQMDSNYFDNPEKFDPERFSDENKDNIVPFTFYPFGEGPRNCIGGRLGLIQVKLGLVQFIRKYEITPTKETPIPIKLDALNVLTQVSGGLYLNLRKISN